jgi:hypothetical protein
MIHHRNAGAKASSTTSASTSDGSVLPELPNKEVNPACFSSSIKAHFPDNLGIVLVLSTAGHAQIMAPPAAGRKSHIRVHRAMAGVHHRHQL